MLRHLAKGTAQRLQAGLPDGWKLLPSTRERLRQFDTHGRSDPTTLGAWRRDVHAIADPGLSEFGKATVWKA